MEWVETLERQDETFKQRVEEELAAMLLEQQLVRLREAQGLSQAQVARALGVSQQAIAKAESGQTKNLELRRLLTHVMALGGRLEVTIRPNSRVSRLIADTVKHATKSIKASPSGAGTMKRAAKGIVTFRRGLRHTGKRSVTR
jgi:transcriptional regulator with XRE-family HTH domain